MNIARRCFLKNMTYIGVGSAFSQTLLARTPQWTAGGAQSIPPNIIFIMLDDMGYGDLAVYGQEHIQMPNVNRMAREGIRYTDVYCGSTICAPSRSVLMTGQHTGKTRVRGNMPRNRDEGAVRGVGGLRQPLLKEDVTVAEVLQGAGYVTGITGKWGLGEPDTPGVPNEQGFDEWLGLLNQRRAHSYFPEFIWRNQEKVVLEGNTGTTRHFDVEEHYVHDLFTEFALEFIEEHGARNRPFIRPFFLYLPYTVPHSRWQIPELEPYTVDQDWTREQKVYASMLTRVDRDIGLMFERLKALGIDEQTIVFFCSDNGAQNRYQGVFQSSGPLRGMKRSMYDGGLRTPMVVRWPGKIEPDTVSNDIWYFADVLPTLAELAGVDEIPENIDGVSVVESLLTGHQPELRDRKLYWEDHERGFRQAARWGDWKAVRNRHDRDIELYNLAEDIGESNDIAADHPDVVAEFERFFVEARTPSNGWPSPLD